MRTETIEESPAVRSRSKTEPVRLKQNQSFTSTAPHVHHQCTKPEGGHVCSWRHLCAPPRPPLQELFFFLGEGTTFGLPSASPATSITDPSWAETSNTLSSTRKQSLPPHPVTSKVCVNPVMGGGGKHAFPAHGKRLWPAGTGKSRNTSADYSSERKWLNRHVWRWHLQTAGAERRTGRFLILSGIPTLPLACQASFTDFSFKHDP